MDWIVLVVASRVFVKSVGLVRGCGCIAVIDLRALRADRRPRVLLGLSDRIKCEK
jgi:hypothetical protein